MSDIRRVKSDPKEGDQMSTSIAAQEAFDYLNALQKQEYRGWGDTATAARDRVARKVGISPAQAERLWKRWQTMKSVNGDVYRALRNKYEALCLQIETQADALERETQIIEAQHASLESRRAAREGMESASTGAESIR